MQEKQDRLTVYEIGYLIASSVPEDKVGNEIEAIKKIINNSGASVIAEGTPIRQPLAYTIKRKTVGGSYDKYDEAYFGWVKFEVDSSAIESVKKSIEILPSIIRVLVITTVKENTYLGKHAPVVKTVEGEGNKVDVEQTGSPVDSTAEPATVEEIDKSIDAMVKEA